MTRVCLALALLAAMMAPASADVSVGGVQKVISMLQDMSAHAKTAKKDEEVAFAEFSTWCNLESENLRKAIAKQGEEMELLSAEIAALTSDVSTLGEEIGGLQADIIKYEGDSKAQDAERAKDHKDFLAEQQDYGESVDALSRAIMVLQKQSHDRPGLVQTQKQRGAAREVLLEISSKSRLPAAAQSMVAAFLDMMSDGAQDAMAVPEANAYEFQSGGIVDMLKRLQSEFTAKKGQCEKEEMNSEHAYNMVIEDLTDSIQNSQKTVEEKTILKQSKAGKAALNKKTLGATTASKAEDESTLSDMNTECSEKSMSFDEKQKLRAEEIEAIAQAVAIMSSDDVSGNAGKHLDLAQIKATSFAQLGVRGTAQGKSEGIRRRVSNFIEDEGRRLHSKGLSMLAETLAANPFAKVKKLIDGMITRLLEEANADASHEGFCDKEMGESKITRNKLSEEIDALQAAVEDGKATIMMLSQDIATLNQEVADLEQAMTEATGMRTAEKAKNTETIADSEAAQKAVTAATAVLKDFYTKAGMATGLIQTAAKPQMSLMGHVKMGTDEWNSLANPNFEGTVDKGHKAGMQTFGETNKGQQDQAGGVLAMLEVILSDFATLEADTRSAESISQQSYDGFMTESKKNTRVKSKKTEMNDADKVAAEQKLREDTADMKATQDELLAAERYYDKLVPQCIDKGQTFEERTAAREEEIASLKQALEILSSEDIA